MEIGEEIVFKLITNSGSARSNVFEAFQFCQVGDYEGAKKLMKEADENILEAHKAQTKLIQKEASGEVMEVRLLMVHAQDHLMTCILAKEIMINMMKMQEELNEIKMHLSLSK